MNDLIRAFYDALAADVGPDDKPVPCNDDLAPAWADIERRAGVTLPHTFKAWAAACCTDHIDLGILRLPANHPSDPLAEVRRAVCGETSCHRRPRELGLVPFGGEEGNDAGPLCFDARAGADPEAWPVRFWEHDAPRGDAREIGPLLFSSFAKLLECCTRYLIREVEAVQAHGGGPDAPFPPLTPHIREFFDIDPAGAGGPGRAYWTAIIEAGA